MKYAAHILALTVTLALVSTTAAAQLPSKQKLVTQVPFEFTVGKNLVPAGECIIERAGVGDNALLIYNRTGKVHLAALAMPDDASKESTRYSMVFHKYGEQYFLTGIRIAGTRRFYKMPVSSRERELQLAHMPATEQDVIASVQ